ncbi:LLM class flavin-dependent oxidoreductase [Nocardioides mangrovicus]|uniref:LLM class flavin-dependent oxidoreductase n=1 Tax=Nocardioides mangrovicus TaxID=2478913 RepID=A0A3L8P0M5_9ACTN|nr:LLM class flavin-dependent oxidoreductase [Nocardioides mangrovicus]
MALDGAGWHPAAWREPTARPRDLLGAAYWTDLVREAEAGLLDLVTIEDSLAIQADAEEDEPRTDRVQGRLDAVLIAARVAPLTQHIGLVPTVVATHTEPFHTSKAVATLDYVSHGRAGVRVRVSTDPAEAALIGRRQAPSTGEALAEADDYVEVTRRLWDSWEDDAEIRDAATGRFVDVDKLHYVDFEGEWFSVRGPSITPRPPQGQPVVAALAHGPAAQRLVATSADLGFVTPRSTADVLRALEAVRDGVAGRRVRLLGDVLVVLEESETRARERLHRLDLAAGGQLTSDAHVFAGTAADLADLVEQWHDAGLDGVRLRPAVLPHDLEEITRSLVPELQRRGRFRTAYPEGASLGELLGLRRPRNRYAA